MISARNILSAYVHFDEGGKSEVMPVSDAFWSELAAGKHPQLDRGRLMTAFSFTEPWAMWERHPAGDELVMLLSGTASLVLEESGKERIVFLTEPGSYVIVPQNVWHTARTTEPTTLLFLTAGAGTEHRPLDG